MELTNEQIQAASKLNDRQLAFANLVLTKHQHGMNDGDCAIGAGFGGPDTTPNSIASQAATMLQNIKIAEYVAIMKCESAKQAGLTLAKVDKCIHEIMSGNIADYMETEERPVAGGGVKYVPVLKCHLQDLPREVAAQIQEMKMTRDGLQIKTYSRLDAVRLAAQRLGGLTDKREVSGPGGAPLVVESITKNMTAEEAAKLYAQEVL
jgi:hypothetical protein